jgi:putative hemolysin
MYMHTLANFGLVLFFVLLGGAFAATEIALVSLRDSQLSSLERRGARGARVAQLARDPNRFLAAVQIGVTVAGFFSAAYGGSTLAPDLAAHLESLGLSSEAAETIALVLVTLVIAYLSLVLGELVPKRLALQKAAGVALIVAPGLDRLASLMRPVIWLLSMSTNALVRMVGGDPAASAEQLSEEELRELVSTHESLEEHERHIFGELFAATETTLKEVMRPRPDVEFLPAALSLREAAARVSVLPYSRYPVTGAGFDDVIGFVHVRDLLVVRPDDRSLVGERCRPILMLPGTNHVLPAVATMRNQGVHIAVVLDEYGGTDGIVTFADLLEEVVGGVRDEYVAAIGPAGALSIDGGTSLDDFADQTGLRLAEGDYDTVGGFVMAHLGRVPLVGDIAQITPDSTLEVSAMKGARVVAVVLHSDRGEVERPGGLE